MSRDRSTEDLGEGCENRGGSDTQYLKYRLNEHRIGIGQTEQRSL